jgi:hypothetical protein
MTLTPEEIAALADVSRIPPPDVVLVGLAMQIKRALDDHQPLDPTIVGALADRVLSVNGYNPHA